MFSYVKEFVHGDFGRTKPNLGELLNRETDILQLDVEVGGEIFVYYRVKDCHSSLLTVIHRSGGRYPPLSPILR